MVIDVENEAFDEYMSMADAGYEDLRTEADVEELSVIEAIMVDEREALRSDIADLPDVEVWEEEIVSPQTVSVDGKGVAHISQANIMEQELRTLSEQGLSILQDDVGGKQIFKQDVQIIESNVEAKLLPLDSGEAATAVAVSSDGAESQRAEIADQKTQGANDTLKKTKSQAKTKRTVDVLDDVEIGAQEDSDAKTLTDSDKTPKKVKKTSKKQKQKEEGNESTNISTGVGSPKSIIELSEQYADNIEKVEILEAAPSLKELIVQSEFAKVLEASQIEAIIQEQVSVLSGAECNVFNLEDPVLHQAVIQQLSEAVVAQQMEQGYFSDAQDLPAAFSPEGTSVEFSEFHSLGEPVICQEEYGYESAEQLVPEIASEHVAQLIQGNLNDALIELQNQFASADAGDFYADDGVDVEMLNLEAMTQQDSLTGDMQLSDMAEIQQSSDIQSGPKIEILDEAEECTSAFAQKDNRQEGKATVLGIVNEAKASVTVMEPPQFIDDRKVQKTKKPTNEKKRASESVEKISSDSHEKSVTNVKKVKALIDETIESTDTSEDFGRKISETVSGNSCETVSQVKLCQAKLETIADSVHEAMKSPKSSLSDSDLIAVMASVEQLVIENKPMQIMESMKSTDERELLVHEAEIQVSKEQLEDLKSMKNPALDLEVSVTFTDLLSETKEVIHKIISPKSPQLLDKLVIQSNEDQVTVPVFEITEVRDEGKTVKRKISINTANVILSDENTSVVDDLSIEKLCVETVMGIMTDEAETLNISSVIEGAGMKFSAIENIINLKDIRNTDTLAGFDNSAIAEVSADNKEKLYVPNESVSKMRKDSIQKNIEQAITKAKPELSVADLQSLEATIEQLVTANKPIEIVETLDSRTNRHITVAEAPVEISSNQLGKLKLIKDIAAELGIAVEITETLSDSKQIIHKVISPKSSELMEKWIDTPGDSNAIKKTVPVFEITEIIDEGKIVQRKTSINAVEVVATDHSSGNIDLVNLTELCTAAVTQEVIMQAQEASTTEANVQQHSNKHKKIVTAKTDAAVIATSGEAVGSHAPADQLETKSLIAKDSKCKERKVGIVESPEIPQDIINAHQIYKDVEKAVTQHKAAVTSSDLEALQTTVQHIIDAKIPVDICEVIDSSLNKQVIIQAAQVQISSSQLEDWKEIVNVSRDLEVAVEVTESLTDNKQIIHKVITPKNAELINKLMNDAANPDNSIPVFEITQIIENGKVVKRKTSVNIAHVVTDDSAFQTMDVTDITQMCTKTLTATMSEELNNQIAKVSDLTQILQPERSQQVKNIEIHEAAVGVAASKGSCNVDTEDNAAKDADLKKKPSTEKEKPSRIKSPKPEKVKKAIAPSEEIVSACEEILNAQGGFVEDTHLKKYLDISATADEYLDQVIELSSDASSEIDESKEVLLNKKKILLQKKQELIEKQQEVKRQKEIEVAAKAAAQKSLKSSNESKIDERKIMGGNKVQQKDIVIDASGAINADDKLSTLDKTLSQQSSAPAVGSISVDIEALNGAASNSKRLIDKFEKSDEKLSQYPVDLLTAVQSKLEDAGKQAESILKTLEKSIATPVQQTESIELHDGDLPKSFEGKMPPEDDKLSVDDTVRPDGSRLAVSETADSIPASVEGRKNAGRESTTVEITTHKHEEEIKNSKIQQSSKMSDENSETVSTIPHEIKSLSDDIAIFKKIKISDSTDSTQTANTSSSAQTEISDKTVSEHQSAISSTQDVSVPVSTSGKSKIGITEDIPGNEDDSQPLTTASDTREVLSSSISTSKSEDMKVTSHTPSNESEIERSSKSNTGDTTLEESTNQTHIAAKAKQILSDLEKTKVSPATESNKTIEPKQVADVNVETHEETKSESSLNLSTNDVPSLSSTIETISESFQGEEGYENNVKLSNDGKSASSSHAEKIALETTDKKLSKSTNDTPIATTDKKPSKSTNDTPIATIDKKLPESTRGKPTAQTSDVISQLPKDSHSITKTDNSESVEINKKDICSKDPSTKSLNDSLRSEAEVEGMKVSIENSQPDKTNVVHDASVKSVKPNENERNKDSLQDSELKDTAEQTKLRKNKTVKADAENKIPIIPDKSEIIAEITEDKNDTKPNLSVTVLDDTLKKLEIAKAAEVDKFSENISDFTDKTSSNKLEKHDANDKIKNNVTLSDTAPEFKDDFSENRTEQQENKLPSIKAESKLSSQNNREIGTAPSTISDISQEDTKAVQSPKSSATDKDNEVSSTSDVSGTLGKQSDLRKQEEILKKKKSSKFEVRHDTTDNKTTEKDKEFNNENEGAGNKSNNKKVVDERKLTNQKDEQDNDMQENKAAQGKQIKIKTAEQEEIKKEAKDESPNENDVKENRLTKKKGQEIELLKNKESREDEHKIKTEVEDEKLRNKKDAQERELKVKQENKEKEQQKEAQELEQADVKEIERRKVIDNEKRTRLKEQEGQLLNEEEERLTLRKEHREQREKELKAEEEKIQRANEEREAKRKKQKEEEAAKQKESDARELKLKQDAKEKELKKTKKEAEESEQAEIEEIERKKKIDDGRKRVLKEQEEQLIKEEEERQTLRKKQREQRDKEQKEEEERILKINEEREASRKKQREEETARQKEIDAREEEAEKRKDMDRKNKRDNERMQALKEQEGQLLKEEEEKIALRKKQRDQREKELKEEEDKIQKTNEEREAKRKKQKEEEAARQKEADALELKLKQEAKEKELKKKKESEERELAEIKEIEKTKTMENKRRQVLKEQEEQLIKEEEERQALRKIQREQRERELKEEEEKIQMAHEEREAKRKKQKEEDATKQKEADALEKQEEKLRLDNLEKRRQEIDRKRKEDEKTILEDEVKLREKRKQKREAEEQASKDEQERLEAELEQKRERRKKLREAEEEEEKKMKAAAELKKKAEEEARNEEKKKKKRQYEEEEKAFEETERKRRETKIKRDEADKLRAQEEEMLATMERKRVDEDKKRLEEELRRREEVKRRQEDEIRKRGEESLRKVIFVCPYNYFL